jgi:hypothetical protein
MPPGWVSAGVLNNDVSVVVGHALDRYTHPSHDGGQQVKSVFAGLLLTPTPVQEPETDQQPKGVLATAQSCKAGSTIPVGSHDKLEPA